MKSISKKIRILRKKMNWTQAQLAEELSISEFTIQKWGVGKNIPPITELKRLADVFQTTITELTEEDMEEPGCKLVDSVSAEHFCKDYDLIDSTPHEIYHANLRDNALLHRFENKCGVPYSAVYIGREECFSCERDQELAMITYWLKMCESKNSGMFEESNS